MYSAYLYQYVFLCLVYVMCINIYIAMGMLLIVPKQSEMDDQLGGPSQHQKSFYT